MSGHAGLCCLRRFCRDTSGFLVGGSLLLIFEGPEISVFLSARLCFPIRENRIQELEMKLVDLEQEVELAQSPLAAPYAQ